MSLVERCIHQLRDDIVHSVLFKEQLEKCKLCQYNPEENKVCLGYVSTAYEMPDKKPEPVSENNLISVYSVVDQNLNKAIA
jgi:hypothetical protein